MTKPTDSKVPAAFQAMLAFLQMMTRGFFSHSGEQPAVIGVQAVDAITSYYREHPRLIALRDLVQAAADEHAGSASPAAPSDEEEAFRALRLSDIKDNHARAEVSFTGAACTNAHLDRAWLIGEVERLRAIEQRGDRLRVAAEAAVLSLIAYGEAPAHEARALRGALDARWTAPQPSASHIGVDPGLRGSGRTVTQVREPAFDRLDAAVDVLRDTSPGWARTVIEAFDAYAASRATLTGTITAAEQVTFTRLEGETLEAFRARIALHLNGMGSTRFVLPGQGRNREALGQIVHGVRRQWAAENHHGTSDWTDLADFERERDCRIGVALATVGQGYAGAIDAAEPIAKVERPSRNKMTRAAYQQVIAENIAWCEQQQRTLERDHIILILQHAVAAEYPRPLTEDAATAWAKGMCGAADLAAPADAVTEALLAAARGEYPTT